MAKLLILANNDLGLYKFRKELLEDLLKDNEVFISLPNGEFISRLTDLGCKFIETKISRRGKNPITDLKLMIKYKRIIEQIKPDAVLTYTIKPNVYGGIVCMLMKKNYITNITGLGTAVANKGILQAITLCLYRIALCKSDCVFFQNKENLEFIARKKVVKGKYRLIPGSGVNLDEYSLLDYPNDESINFLFISRVMKQKGIDQYLEAAEYIKGKYNNTEFHILGFCEDAYEGVLKEMQDRDIIKYHGMQKDVKKFHAISHCTIHPTYYPEGMSNVLLESASSGRPIITTNRSGCREIIEDQINGLVIEEKNTKDLIDKIEKFIGLTYDERKKMGLKGRKKVEKEFDRKIVINAYVQEINKIKNREGR